MFHAIGALVEGHKATGKYVTGGIVNKPDQPSTSSGPIVKEKNEPSPSVNQAEEPLDHHDHHSPLPPSESSHSPAKSPPSDASDLPEDGFKPKDNSSSDEAPAAKRHRQSKVALAAQAPTKPKKRSGIQILDGMSTDMKKFGSNIESSFASTSASIDTAAQVIQTETPSTHSQALAIIYASSLERIQRYAAIDLFTEKPVMAETYVNTPPHDRDDWLQYILSK